ncbi:MAG: hypothetical protein E5W34_02710, partial [Mesorhizobium sp.]
YKPEQLTVFNYSAMGNDLLEDGLYALEDKLKDPAFEDKMVRFVRASMKGWKYAVDNSDEAAGIVMDNGGQDENHQKRMMGEVAKLVDNADGKLDPATYERTAKALLDQKIIANTTWLKANPKAKKFFELVQIPIADVNAENQKVANGEKSNEQIMKHATDWIAAHHADWEKWIAEAKAAK